VAYQITAVCWGREVFADEQAIGSARRTFEAVEKRQRRLASLTANSTVHKFRSSRSVPRSKKRERETEEKKIISLLSIPLKALALRDETEWADVPRSSSIAAENSTKRHALRVSNARMRVLVSYFSLFLSLSRRFDSSFILLIVALEYFGNVFFFFFNSNDTRNCLHAR